MREIKWIERLKELKHLRAGYFRDSRDEIARKNIDIMRAVALVTLILAILFMIIADVIFPRWSLTIEYMAVIVIVSIFFLCAWLYSIQESINYWMVQGLCGTFCVLILVGVIGIDVMANPDAPSAFMPIVLVLIPAIFIMRYQMLFPIMIVSDFIYCVLVLQVKTINYKYNDVFSAIAGLFFGILVAWIIMRIRVDDNNVRRQYQRMSSIDMLTGLLNKGTCEQNIAEYLKLRDGSTMCGLMILDVDDFKQVNDNLGHQRGDELLENVGRILARTFRSTDIVGRVGGDEFLVLIRNVTDMRLFEKKCGQIQSMMKLMTASIETAVTCSIGIAVVGNEEVSFENLFQLADDALYEAKSFGKNQYVIHTTKSGELRDENKPVMLIADDSEMNREILREIFQGKYELVEASEGNEALSLLSQYKDCLAIMLLDLHIPGMNGFDILRYINSRASYDHLPIIVISADEEGEEEVLRLGATDMIRKPFEAGVVKLRVERAVR